jgi:protein TonB
MKYEAYKTQKAEEEAKAKLEQQQKLAQMEAEKEEEKEEEVEQIEIEEVKPEAPQLATQLMTELLLTDTPKEDNEIKANEDIQKDNSVMSTFTQAGSDDINLIKEHKEEVVQEKPREEKKKEEVFTHVEQMPKFPGGDAELYKFISNNLNYPAMAIENNVQGRVVVQFVVTKDGSIGNVKVVRSVDRDLDNEAIRVCKKLPKFIPGKQNGQPVNVWYTLPVTFKLQN